jgi:hypothetical protein
MQLCMQLAFERAYSSTSEFVSDGAMQCSYVDVLVHSSCLILTVEFKLTSNCSYI